MQHSTALAGIDHSSVVQTQNKQKTMLTQNAEINKDVWVDTAQYPPSSKININREEKII